MDMYLDGVGAYGEDRGIDPLTGLGNRRAFDRQLDQALGQGGEASAQLGLFFVSLDHFKRINDQYGHEGGDQVLVVMANRLRVWAELAGCVCRIGGDEFVVLQPGLSDWPETAVFAERLLELVCNPLGTEELPEVALELDSLCVTASIGVAVGTPGVAADELLRSADAALYGAIRRRSDSTGGDGAIYFADLPPGS